jgi:DNA-binding HxlR family transcriptional regulator
MRSYAQFCALARSLDILGDRWTLLIIRELFARDSRYSDLRDGLPGIATNLLADRLRHLQDTGLVEAHDAPSPIRSTLYRLTPRGRELGPVLRSLVVWGMPLLDSEQGEDAFRPQWLMLALRILFDEVDVTNLAPLSLVIVNDYEPVTVDITDATIETHLGQPSSTTTVELDGDPQDIVSLFTGATDQGSISGIDIQGPDDAVKRLYTLIDRLKADGDRASDVSETAQP